MDMPGSLRLLFQLCVALVGSRALGQRAVKPLEFEIASVKAAGSGVRSPNLTLGEGESLTIASVPLRMIIIYAYELRDFQLAGGPGWLDDERYDIVAKTSVEDRAGLEKQRWNGRSGEGSRRSSAGKAPFAAVGSIRSSGAPRAERPDGSGASNPE
jgi:hypothetical protein